jgi:MFS family permease
LNKNPLAALGIRTISSLRVPAYRIYFLALFGQFAAMSMQFITNSLLIYRLTGSSALLGLSSLAHAIPMITLSLLGGALADRFPKKRIMLIGLFACSLLAFLTGLCLVTGWLSKEREGSWIILIVISFLVGIIFGSMLPARQAIVPELVSHDQITNAIALNMLGMNVTSLIGPAVAGFLIDGVGFASVYFVMTALNLYATIMVLFIHPVNPVNHPTGSIINEIKSGFSYMFKDRMILMILLFTLMVVVLSMPYQQLLPIYVDDILRVGAKGLGILMSVSGAGALVGSLVLASLPSKKRGVLLLVSGLVSAISLFIFAFSKSWGLSLTFIIFIGLGQTLRGTIGGALLQSYTNPAYMGRVMSIFMMQWGVMTLCTFFAGLAAEKWAVEWVIGGLAIALAAVTLSFFVAIPKLRKLD